MARLTPETIESIPRAPCPITCTGRNQQLVVQLYSSQVLTFDPKNQHFRCSPFFDRRLRVDALHGGGPRSFIDLDPTVLSLELLNIPVCDFEPSLESSELMSLAARGIPVLHRRIRKVRALKQSDLMRAVNALRVAHGLKQSEPGFISRLESRKNGKDLLAANLRFIISGFSVLRRPLTTVEATSLVMSAGVGPVSIFAA